MPRVINRGHKRKLGAYKKVARKRHSKRRGY